MQDVTAVFVKTEKKTWSPLDGNSIAVLCKLGLSEGKDTPLPSIFGWVSWQMSTIYGQDISIYLAIIFLKKSSKDAVLIYIYPLFFNCELKKC